MNFVRILVQYVANLSISKITTIIGKLSTQELKDDLVSDLGAKRSIVNLGFREIFILNT